MAGNINSTTLSLVATTFILLFFTASASYEYEISPALAPIQHHHNSLSPALAPTHHHHNSLPLPLHTHSRWILGSDGKRVKLACVNWPSHLHVVVAEGLNHQPLDAITKSILAMGFNCVRLTWPIRLATDGILAVVTTVRQSFINNGLYSLIPGLEANNPDILDLPLIDAFRAVVENLADNNVMVILDNHLTEPGWCCSEHDDNGFFGDKFFNPKDWILGLSEMASMFRDTPHVVGMSLRNELRGPRSNVPDWYKYMQEGAEAVHSANPNILVILSGLNYDSDLSFLKTKQVNISFVQKRKLVFEVHWYSFTSGKRWDTANSNDMCANVVGSMYNKTLFLPSQGWPLMMTEFGLNMEGENIGGNRYLNCLVAVAAKMDLDWAYWALPSSYYLRSGNVEMNDTFGLLTSDWKLIHNGNAYRTKFMKMIQSIQPPFRGPNIGGHEAKPYQIIFHPSTGQCVVVVNAESEYSLQLGPCSEAQSWRYDPIRKALYTTTPKNLMLQGIDAGQKPKLVPMETPSGVDDGSKWEKLSASRLHLSTRIAGVWYTGGQVQQVCLDVQKENHKVIVTEHCKCLTKDYHCTPFSQWFMILSAKENPKPSAFLDN